ncbi:MAG: adenylate kinase [Chloroflexi bacterium]|nr:adenylate kinase [Chloroflexota bacterium]MCL5275627.1 adenylate kinase [Chloroflexota bacterium]
MNSQWYGIVLLGGPGSGKGTQAVLLASALNIPHISTGDLFRYNLKQGTPLGILAKSYMDRGELVPDEVTVAMVRDRLSQPDCALGFILDGFPRNVAQAEALDAVLAEFGRVITSAPYLHVNDAVLLERLSNRWTCRSCGAVFNKVTPPPREGCKKEHCDGELYRRPDDEPETQKNRIRVYEKQTAPLIIFYAKRGLISEISGEQDVEHVQLDMLRAVNLGMSGSSSQGAMKPSAADEEC